MKNIFLETNSYSRCSKGDFGLDKLVSTANRIYISVITIGELYYGFKKGVRENKNLELLKTFLGDSRVRILKVNITTSKIYGVVKYLLISKGRPVPENDIWIAAQAIEAESVLLTYDRHFLEIPQVKVWRKLK